MADPGVGLAQTASHLGMAPVSEFEPFSPQAVAVPSAATDTGNVTPADIDAAVNQREGTYQRSRQAAGQSGADWTRLLGNLISPVNAAIPGGTPENIGLRLGKAALVGAGLASAQPVEGESGDFWSTKAKQAMAGAALGPVAEGVASGVFPRASGDAQTLMEAGIPLTPGQQASWMRRPEEALKSFPILGNFIRSAEGRGTEGFNRAVINQVLEPIGDKLPKNVAVGNDAIGYAQRAVSDKYDNLLPNVTFQADPEFANDLAEIGRSTRGLPPAQRSQFNNTINDRLMDRLDPNGTMDGQTLKKVESELGNYASNYRSSSDGAQRDLGYAVYNVQQAMRDALARQNPEYAAELQNINASYAMLARAEKAAQNRATSEGIFTPSDMLSAIRSADKTARHRSFAAGDALMQEFAQTANRVLPSRMPDSGTAERTFWGMMAADIMGGMLWSGDSSAVPTVAKALAGAGVLGIPYTRAGQKVIGYAPAGVRGIAPMLPAPVGGIVGSQP